MAQSLVSVLKLRGNESVMSVAGIHGSSDMKTEVVTARVSTSEAKMVKDEVTICSHSNLNLGDKVYDFEELKQK